MIGSRVDIDGRRREIVGILPPGADLRDERIDVWLPLGLNPSTRDFRGYHVLSVIGRLRDSVNADQGHAELLALMRNWAARTGLPENEHVFSLDPDPRRFHELRMTPLRDAVLGNAGRMIWTLQAAVALVLLIVCANLGSLLLARSEARRREYAVRLALGAGSGRLLRQSLVEALVLAAAAAGFGLVAAQAGVKALLFAYPNALPRGGEVSVDSRTAWFAVGVSLLAAVIFSLAPAGYARGRQLAAALSDGRDRGSSAVRHHVRRALVIAQVGLAVVLVIVAALFVRTVRNLSTVDAGFDRSRLVTFTIAAPAANIGVGRMPVYQRVLDTIRQRPGVERATAMAELPPNQQFFSESTVIETYAPVFQRPLVNVDFYQSVLSDYFETMGIPIVRGRSFRPSDSDPGAMVVVVNERLANTFWKGRDPIGQHIKPAWGKWVPWFTVIGVARDVRQAGVERPAGTEMYFFVDQMSRAPGPLGRTPEKINVVLRTGLSPASLLPLVQRAVHEADPTVPVSHLRDMETVFADSIERARLLRNLSAPFRRRRCSWRRSARTGCCLTSRFSVAERWAFGWRLAPRRVR